MIPTRKSESDIDLFCPPPTVPLKQHVTLGSTDTKKELMTSLLLKKRSGSSNLTASSNDAGSFAMRYGGTTMSENRVSKIFLRERHNLAADGRFSRKSNFASDLQALFDTNELEEHFNDDDDHDVDDVQEQQQQQGPTTTKPSTPNTTSLIDDEGSRIITFGGVEIREYPIIPGDSPAGFKGCPLTIGWTPIATVRIADLDKYESVRDGHRRTTKELTIPASQRMEILRNQGFSRSEIQKFVKEANIARRQRRETMATLKHQAAYERLESIQRKTLNILTLGRRSRAKKEYLKKYVPSYGVVVVAQ